MTLGRKITKVIGYILVLMAVNALQEVRVETFTYYPYSPDDTNWGLFAILCITMIAGVCCIKIGSKTTVGCIHDDIQSDGTTDQLLNNSKSILSGKTGNMLNYRVSNQKKYTSKQILLGIILSMALIIYVCLSLSFMAEGEELTACGVFFYIPCYSIIVVYYLWLIWSNRKITGDKILLLPLLQKVNLFKIYKDDFNGRIELVKTVLPFLLSIFICPMLTSILYDGRHGRYQEWLMVILLLPPVILAISLTKRLMQSWVNQKNDHSEVEE